MERKYPDLIKYRRKNETWKSLFIRTAYYLARLKEQYGIPYFRHMGINLELVFKNKLDPTSSLLIKASKIGNLNVIKQVDLNTIISEPVLRNVLRTAGWYNHLDIVLYLLEKYPLFSAIAGGAAASNGNLGIVQYLIENDFISKDLYNNLLAHAAGGNQKQVVDYLISKGANDFRSAIDYARMDNHLPMVNYLQTFL
jgi:hypothetical protein